MSLNAIELIDALTALSAELPHCPLEIIKGAIDLCDLPSQLARIETDASATTAGEIAVRLEPSDRLRDLMAAIRARNVDRLVVEDSGHNESPYESGAEP